MDSSLRIKLAVVPEKATGDPPGSPAQSGSPKAQVKAFSGSVSPKLFDLYMQDSGGLRTNRRILKALQRTGVQIPLPEITDGTHLRVVVTGEIKSEKKPGEGGMVVAMVPGAYTPSENLSTCPNALKANTKWTNFEISDVIPKSLLSTKSKSLYIALYPGNWLDICGYGADRNSHDIRVRNMRFEISGVNRPDFANKRLIYY